MRYDFDDLYEGPRFQNRARRRKVKLIISSIAIVIGIVLVIGIINIFSGGSEETNLAVSDDDETEQSQTEEETISTDSNESTEEGNESATDSSASFNHNNKPEEKELSNNSETTPIDEEELLIPANEQDDDSLVIGTIQKNWEPVGTVQQGEHVIDYTKDSQDWKEMTEAIRVATGLSKDDMIVWWLGNGGASNQVTSTVSSKDQQIYYRVQLEWVDSSGWKPLVVEQLKENDRKPEASATAEDSSEATSN